MIDELRRILKNSTENEMKSLVFQTILRINVLEETDHDTEEHLVKDLKKIYSDFLNSKRNQTDIKMK